MKYQVYNNYAKEIIPGIVIDECAKEQFKDMMEWDEQSWKLQTRRMK